MSCRVLHRTDHRAGLVNPVLLPTRTPRRALRCEHGWRLAVGRLGRLGGTLPDVHVILRRARPHARQPTVVSKSEQLVTSRDGRTRACSTARSVAEDGASSPSVTSACGTACSQRTSSHGQAGSDGLRTVFSARAAPRAFVIAALSVLHRPREIGPSRSPSVASRPLWREPSRWRKVSLWRAKNHSANHPRHPKTALHSLVRAHLRAPNSTLQTVLKHVKSTRLELDREKRTARRDI
jgi:hypothetical protein